MTLTASTPRPGVDEDALQRCADEPIAVPGAIQPHGALLAVTEPDLAVVVPSANAADVLGTTPASLADVLGPADLDRLRAGLAGDPSEVDPLRVTVAGAEVDLVVHRADGLLLTEWEPLAGAEQAGAGAAAAVGQPDPRRADRLAGPRRPGAHRLRPGDGLPLRPRVERRGGRRGPARGPRALPRPALPGQRHPRPGPRALRDQLAAADPRRDLPAGAAGAGRQPGHRAPAGPLRRGAAQRLDGAPGVPRQHGRGRLDVGVAHRPRPAVGT